MGIYRAPLYRVFFFLICPALLAISAVSQEEDFTSEEVHIRTSAASTFLPKESKCICPFDVLPEHEKDNGCEQCNEQEPPQGLGKSTFCSKHNVCAAPLGAHSFLSDAAKEKAKAEAWRKEGEVFWFNCRYTNQIPVACGGCNIAEEKYPSDASAKDFEYFCPQKESFQCGKILCDMRRKDNYNYIIKGKLLDSEYQFKCS